MQRTSHWLAALMAVAVVLGLATAEVRAKTIQLDEAAIYIEINDTDGDAGIQIFLDAEGWDSMQVLAPGGDTVLDIMAAGSVGIQGVTELFLESAEPSFEEQPLEDFLDLFPPGNYKFQGTTTEGDTLKGMAQLTHVIPDAPVLLTPEEGADSVDPDNTVISWAPVANPPGSAIDRYEVVVEREEGDLRVFSVEVDPSTTSVTVPPEFMQAGTAYKYEVLAIESGGNRTISEREFETE